MDKKSKNTLIISIIALALVLIGVTYAYFSARITGLESASTISLTAGRMSIVYSEGDENVTVSGIYPREEAWVTKTITLTGYNTTDKDMYYDLGFNITTNTFKGGQLSFSLTGVGANGTKIANIDNKAITKPSGFYKIGTGSFAQANGDTHVYTINIYFKDTGKDQNINQEAVFNAKIHVKENMIVGSNPCYTDGYEAGDPITVGTTYITDYYTYYYGKTNEMDSIIDSNQDGWWVITNESLDNIIDYIEPTSTDPITERLCTSVNDKPIVSMSSTYHGSRASSINLTGADTSHVTDMRNMFRSSGATTLDLSSFDTSNVTDMSGMFYMNIDATSIDLSSFDTSNVTTMKEMFYSCSATSLDLSNFDTSNVTNMKDMFSYAHATSLDLSSFDTSKVTNMFGMFNNNRVTTSVDLSSFDTSNVTDMTYMFNNSVVTSLDLSSFDTSSVTIMYRMFAGSAATTGYARTQADADRFNNVAGSLANGNNPSTSIPNTLHFVVQ